MEQDMPVHTKGVRAHLIDFNGVLRFCRGEATVSIAGGKMKGASKCEPQFVFEFREGSLTLHGIEIRYSITGHRVQRSAARVS